MIFTSLTVTCPTVNSLPVLETPSPAEARKGAVVSRRYKAESWSIPTMAVRLCTNQHQLVCTKVDVCDLSTIPHITTVANSVSCCQVTNAPSGPL